MARPQLAADDHIAKISGQFVRQRLALGRALTGAWIVHD
jgi:hypothetical protein